MSELIIITVCIALLFAAAIFVTRLSAVRSGRFRLQLLQEVDEERRDATRGEEIDWIEGTEALRLLDSRLGRAGYFTVEQQHRVKVLVSIALLAVVVCSAGYYLIQGKVVPAFLTAMGITYLGVTAFLIYLRYRARDLERESLFQLPIFLESVILLVESGLGVLPAIERVVTSKESVSNANPVSHLFRLVYELSTHGIPVSQALEAVGMHSHQRIIRHVMLHLDMSASEGGELIPSLRSLSDHSHNEWRLSVEQRVRRLENFVVFPVFASVIGLMLLTVSVPIVPLLNLKETLEQRRELVLPTPRFKTLPEQRSLPERQR